MRFVWCVSVWLCSWSLWGCAPAPSSSPAAPVNPGEVTAGSATAPHKPSPTNQVALQGGATPTSTALPTGGSRPATRAAPAGTVAPDSTSSSSTSVNPDTTPKENTVQGVESSPAAQDPTPVLLDEAGQPLPQTDARPSIDSAAFKAGGERLFRAIVEDDVETAMPFFFPVVAYEQVKAIKRPARDWETRLVRHFKRDIHTYHRRLGRDREQCKFLRIQIYEPGVKWTKPHTEGNNVGYFQVRRSVLFYEDAQGRERQLGITALISWRGEWYVVHLNGFE